MQLKKGKKLKTNQIQELQIINITSISTILKSTSSDVLLRYERTELSIWYSWVIPLISLLYRFKVKLEQISESRPENWEGWEATRRKGMKILAIEELGYIRILLGFCRLKLISIGKVFGATLRNGFHLSLNANHYFGTYLLANFRFHFFLSIWFSSIILHSRILQAKISNKSITEGVWLSL